VINKNNKLCKEAKLYYYDCLCDKSCGLIPQSISNHIEQCHNCQKQINQLKVALSQQECIESEQKKDRSAVTTMLQLHFAYIGEHVTCETVRPFLPGLLDPALEIRIPTPITAHLDNCPKCAEDLKAIQKLNLNSTKLYGLSRFFAEGPSPDTMEFSDMAAVSAMVQRADSEFVTIYHVDESAKARKTGKPDDLYTGFPIRVEVIKQKVDIEQPVSTINFAAALKEKITSMNLRPFLKIGVAAAVILIGFVLLLNTTSAKAVTIQQIYKAIETVTNVYISSFTAGDKEPTQEKWISHTLNIYMVKTAKEYVLSNINTMQRQILLPGTSEIQTNKLTEDGIAGIKQKMSGSLDLMPFDDISQITDGYEWHPVDDQIPGVPQGIEIYDWKWTKTTYNSSVFNKWRFFINPKNNLPQKIEISRKASADGEYKPRTVIEVKYLSDDSEILKVIKVAGFAGF
jgi:hypothetical protein